MTVNYQRRLQRYFDKHYGEYDESAEWYPDGAPNRWRFDIPELHQEVTLVCGSDGKVEETVRKMNQPTIPPYFENKDFLKEELDDDNLPMKKACGYLTTQKSGMRKEK